MDAKARAELEVAGGSATPQERPAGALGFLRALGPGRIAALGGVALALAAFFAFIIWRASAPDYTLLFAGLELSDSQRLVQRLDEMGVPYRLSAGGDAVMVPADRVLRLRMSLAEEGMPVGSAVGYELLDRAGPFGTSELQANINLHRAIEGELARSIGTLRQVRSARVHINLPRRELFARQAKPSSASIVLSLRGGELDKRQVAGIKHLVAAAVPDLSPEQVTLVDDSGNLLAQGSGPGGFAAGDAEEYRIALEERLKAKIVQLLERSVGPGRVDAEVSAEVDFDEIATTTETYDPASQVVRSTQTTEERSNSAERRNEGQVSVANNLPTERTQQQEPGQPSSSERSNRTEEVVNYEISRVVRNQTHRGGALRRLSIAVQVDGTQRTQPDGTVVHEPRSAEELQQLEALVRGAAGLDDGRGDRVEIVSRRFVQPDLAAEAEDTLLGLPHESYWRAAELATYALLTLLVLLLGVRPLLRRLFPSQEPASSVSTLTGVATPLLAQTAADPGAGEPLLEDGTARLADGPGTTVALRNVLGQVKASLVEEVAGFVNQHPDEAVRVVRSWLHGK